MSSANAVVDVAVSESSGRTAGADTSPAGDGGKSFAQEQLFTTAVKFLQSSAVVHSSTADKHKFLRKKGLTDAEIERAIVEAQVEMGVTHHVPATAPAPTGNRLRHWSLLVVLGGGAFYACHRLYKEFLIPFLTDQQAESETLAQRLAENTKTLSTFGSRIDELQKSCDAYNEKIDQLQRSSLADGNREILEVKNELLSLKRLMLNRHQFPEVPVIKPIIPSWQLEETLPAEPAPTASADSDNPEPPAEEVTDPPSDTSPLPESAQAIPAGNNTEHNGLSDSDTESMSGREAAMGKAAPTESAATESAAAESAVVNRAECTNSSAHSDTHTDTQGATQVATQCDTQSDSSSDIVSQRIGAGLTGTSSPSPYQNQTANSGHGPRPTSFLLSVSSDRKAQMAQPIVNSNERSASHNTSGLQSIQIPSSVRLRTIQKDCHDDDSCSYPANTDHQSFDEAHIHRSMSSYRSSDSYFRLNPTRPSQEPQYRKISTFYVSGSSPHGQNASWTHPNRQRHPSDSPTYARHPMAHYPRHLAADLTNPRHPITSLPSPRNPSVNPNSLRNRLANPGQTNHSSALQNHPYFKAPKQNHSSYSTRHQFSAPVKSVHLNHPPSQRDIATSSILHQNTSPKQTSSPPSMSNMFRDAKHCFQPGGHLQSAHIIRNDDDNGTDPSSTATKSSVPFESLQFSPLKINGRAQSNQHKVQEAVSRLGNVPLSNAHSPNDVDQCLRGLESLSEANKTAVPLLNTQEKCLGTHVMPLATCTGQAENRRNPWTNKMLRDECVEKRKIFGNLSTMAARPCICSCVETATTECCCTIVEPESKLIGVTQTLQASPAIIHETDDEYAVASEVFEDSSVSLTSDAVGSQPIVQAAELNSMLEVIQSQVTIEHDGHCGQLPPVTVCTVKGSLYSCSPLSECRPCPMDVYRNAGHCCPLVRSKDKCCQSLPESHSRLSIVANDNIDIPTKKLSRRRSLFKFIMGSQGKQLTDATPDYLNRLMSDLLYVPFEQTFSFTAVTKLVANINIVSISLHTIERRENLISMVYRIKRSPLPSEIHDPLHVQSVMILLVSAKLMKGKIQVEPVVHTAAHVAWTSCRKTLIHQFSSVTAKKREDSKTCPTSLNSSRENQSFQPNDEVNAPISTHGDNIGLNVGATSCSPVFPAADANGFAKVIQLEDSDIPIYGNRQLQNPVAFSQPVFGDQTHYANQQTRCMMSSNKLSQTVSQISHSICYPIRIEAQADATRVVNEVNQTDCLLSSSKIVQVTSHIMDTIGSQTQKEGHADNPCHINEANQSNCLVSFDKQIQTAILMADFAYPPTHADEVMQTYCLLSSSKQIQVTTQKESGGAKIYKKSQTHTPYHVGEVNQTDCLMHSDKRIQVASQASVSVCLRASQETQTDSLCTEDEVNQTNCLMASHKKIQAVSPISEPLCLQILQEAKPDNLLNLDAINQTDCLITSIERRQAIFKISEPVCLQMSQETQTNSLHISHEVSQAMCTDVATQSVEEEQFFLAATNSTFDLDLSLRKGGRADADTTYYSKNCATQYFPSLVDQLTQTVHENLCSKSGENSISSQQLPPMLVSSATQTVLISFGDNFTMTDVSESLSNSSHFFDAEGYQDTGLNSNSMDADAEMSDSTIRQFRAVDPNRVVQDTISDTTLLSYTEATGGYSRVDVMTSDESDPSFFPTENRNMRASVEERGFQTIVHLHSKGVNGNCLTNFPHPNIQPISKSTMTTSNGFTHVGINTFVKTTSEGTSMPKIESSNQATKTDKLADELKTPQLDVRPHRPVRDTSTQSDFSEASSKKAQKEKEGESSVMSFIFDSIKSMQLSPRQVVTSDKSTSYDIMSPNIVSSMDHQNMWKKKKNFSKTIDVLKPGDSSFTSEPRQWKIPKSVKSGFASHKNTSLARMLSKMAQLPIRAKVLNSASDSAIWYRRHSVENVSKLAGDVSLDEDLQPFYSALEFLSPSQSTQTENDVCTMGTQTTPDVFVAAAKAADVTKIKSILHVIKEEAESEGDIMISNKRGGRSRELKGVSLPHSFKPSVSGSEQFFQERLIKSDTRTRSVGELPVERLPSPMLNLPMTPPDDMSAASSNFSEFPTITSEHFQVHKIKTDVDREEVHSDGDHNVDERNTIELENSYQQTEPLNLVEHPLPTPSAEGNLSRKTSSESTKANGSSSSKFGSMSDLLKSTSSLTDLTTDSLDALINSTLSDILNSDNDSSGPTLIR